MCENVVNFVVQLSNEMKSIRSRSQVSRTAIMWHRFQCLKAHKENFQEIQEIGKRSQHLAKVRSRIIFRNSGSGCGSSYGKISQKLNLDPAPNSWNFVHPNRYP